METTRYQLNITPDFDDYEPEAREEISCPECGHQFVSADLPTVEQYEDGLCVMVAFECHGCAHRWALEVVEHKGQVQVTYGPEVQR
jgi:C4-type Zn-finger protein